MQKRNLECGREETGGENFGAVGGEEEEARNDWIWE